MDSLTTVYRLVITKQKARECFPGHSPTCWSVVILARISLSRGRPDEEPHLLLNPTSQEVRVLFSWDS